MEPDVTADHRAIVQLPSMNQQQADILSTVAVQAFTEVFKSSYNALIGAGKWAQSEIKERDFFGRAARRYVERLRERYDSVRIFGMAEPVKLTSIYTRVNILEKITSRQRETLEDLIDWFERDRYGFGMKQETKPGMEVVNQLDSFILLGKPGAGKTTFLKHVAIQAANGALDDNRIPIFVGLKDLADADVPLIEFMARQFDICRFPDAQPFLEHMLKDGRCIVLLDGLDEVPKAKEDPLITELVDFTNKYYGNKFILSCRIAAYNYCFEQFTDVEMADFDDEQVRNFVLNWFGADGKTAASFLKELETIRPIRELARIPLLLTLICLAFDETMGLPANKAELYKEAIDALLKRWDSSRRIKRQEIYQHLSLHKKENMFSRIAATSFEKDQYFFPISTLKQYISDFIENLPEISSETLDVDSELVLKTIEAHHGIFVERARNIYSFSHLTFQEYFTAKYVVDNASKGTLEHLVNSYLLNQKWREVFLIAAGMLKEADSFVLLIHGSIDSMIDKQLTTLLDLLNQTALKEKPRWYNETIYGGRARDQFIDQALAEQNVYLLTALRAIALHEALNSLKRKDELKEFGYKLEVPILISGRIIDTIQNLLFRDVQLSLHNDLINKFFYFEELAKALSHQITEEFFYRIHSDFADKIADYLNATGLLLDCLSADCFISKETRFKVFSELLTAP
jgi:hypothetical protein